MIFYTHGLQDSPCHYKACHIITYKTIQTVTNIVRNLLLSRVKGRVDKQMEKEEFRSLKKERDKTSNLSFRVMGERILKLNADICRSTLTRRRKST